MKLRTQKKVVEAFFFGETAECGWLCTQNNRLVYKGNLIAIWDKNLLMIGTHNNRLYKLLRKFSKINKKSILRDMNIPLTLVDTDYLKYYL
jgi:hypothetical protein